MDNGQNQPMDDGAVCSIPIPLSQLAGDVAADADAGTDRDGQREILQRESEADGGQRVGAVPGDKHAVYDVVKAAEQHGEHRRQRHAHQQGKHRARGHLI